MRRLQTEQSVEQSIGDRAVQTRAEQKQPEWERQRVVSREQTRIELSRNNLSGRDSELSVECTPDQS